MSRHTEFHSRIKHSILAGEFSGAMALMRDFNDSVADNIFNVRTKADIDLQADTYARLLDFFIKGFPDDSRKQMIDDIAAALLSINDSILRAAMKPDSREQYYSALRFKTTTNPALESLFSEYMKVYDRISLAGPDNKPPFQLRKNEESLTVDIFNYIWTMHDASRHDYALIREMLDNDNAPFSLKAQIISALLLSNLTFFDLHGLEILIDMASQYDSELIAARAMTATVLILKKYPDRVAKCRSIRLRIEAWADDLIVYRRLREVLLNILRSLDTPRIESSMRDEIIPGLSKMSPELMNKMKKAASENDIMALEENPEWQKILKSSGIEDKLKELTEIQMEGGDVFMSAFSKLKSFHFFSDTANWFLPFSLSNTNLESSSDILELMKPVIDANIELCDSDRFSMALSLSQMPEAQRKILVANIDTQISQLKEVLADRKIKSSTPEFDCEAKRFMRDIYRYCRLKSGNELSGFITESFDITALPLPEVFTESDEFITLAAEFYFKRKFYSEAAPLFEILTSRQPEDASILEKIGYCHYATRDIPNAIEAYKKAEFFNPESTWLIRQLAICHKLNGDFEKGAEYYSKSLEADPDNYKVIMNLGHCLLATGNNEEALRQYYHADYIRPESDAPKRAIAWAEFQKGDFAKSARFYDRLLADNPSAQDCLNAGHLKFVTGDFKGALENYGRYEKLSGNKLSLDSISDDLKIITDNGGDPDNLKLIIDMLRMPK